jgi:DNA-binding NtrC family response regulator
VASAANEGDPGSSRKAALVVDDDRLIRWALERQLAALGLAAHGAGNGADAAAELRARAFDLVFLDVHLPDANGIDLVPLVEATSPGAYVVVMSADASDEEVERASAGGAQFLEKPFELSDIRALVREGAARGFTIRWDRGRTS